MINQTVPIEEYNRAIDKYNRARALLQACSVHGQEQAARIAELEKIVAEKERLLGEMGKRLSAAETLQSDVAWREKMANVRVRRCPTPEKKIIEYLHDRQLAVPHTEQGDFQEHIKQIANGVGMAERTVRTHLNSVVDKGLVLRRYEGNGKAGSEHRDAAFFRVPDEIMRNPFHIHKLVPVDRGEMRGGDHPKKEVRRCPTCDADDTNVHESGICNVCGEVWMKDLTENRERPVVYDPFPEITPEPTPAPVNWPAQKKYNPFYVPPRPVRPCTLCGEKCWTLLTEASGEKWWGCGCQVIKVEAQAQ